MTENEHVEYLGLAAAVGRLTMALKRTEELLAEVTKERDALAAKVTEADERGSNEHQV